MTRINSNIHPISLTDEHLLAEHREIKRICDVYNKRKLKGIEYYNIPKTFCLGTGHVLFFVDKPTITFLRYYKIHEECFKRGFKTKLFHSNWNTYLYNFDYSKEPKYVFTKQDTSLNVERIKNNILTGKKQTYHYYGKPISITEAVELIENAKVIQEISI